MSQRQNPSVQKWLLWCVMLAWWVAMWLYPVSTGRTRLAGVLLLLVLWAGLLRLTWHRRWWRRLILAGSVFGLGFLAWPSHPPRDAAPLRAEFVASLWLYEGVPYFWGGESPKGIDCSGLVRRGMIDAAFLQGIQKLDPALVRYSLWLWWHDCTAKDLGEQYRGLTVHLLDTPSLNALDHALIQPGDIAVARDGVHTMAYVGDNRWIEADLEAGKVIAVLVPSQDNPWFAVPMNIVRWSILQR